MDHKVVPAGSKVVLVDQRVFLVSLAPDEGRSNKDQLEANKKLYLDQ